MAEARCRGTGTQGFGKRLKEKDLGHLAGCLLHSGSGGNAGVADHAAPKGTGEQRGQRHPRVRLNKTRTLGGLKRSQRRGARLEVGDRCIYRRRLYRRYWLAAGAGEGVSTRRCHRGQWLRPRRRQPEKHRRGSCGRVPSPPTPRRSFAAGLPMGVIENSGTGDRIGAESATTCRLWATAVRLEVYLPVHRSSHALAVSQGVFRSSS